MRQFAGFGLAKETNERFHYLLGHGQTGLSIAFDNPTIMGYDSDHPKAHGEVGKCGVAVDSLRDMETLLDGIDPGTVSTSMTINGPASIMFGFYLANAEKRGVPFERLRGTLQNDILKEYIAQKCWCFPPRPSLRIIVDLIEFATRRVPQWNTISISGYHIREAGSTAAQELAFTLADGFTYVEECLARGLDVDAFAPRLSFFWNSHLDFFEEIAKLRAARRIWARHMRERFKAKRKESWLMRFHTQTAGCSLWDKQPENNIVRTAFEALAAVLGGTQSLHTNSMDETIALPSDKAVKIALRTQQVIAHELGVTETIDPLAGSYYVESLTNRLEEEAEDYFRRVPVPAGDGAQAAGDRRRQRVYGAGREDRHPAALHLGRGRDPAEAGARRAAPHARQPRDDSGAPGAYRGGAQACRRGEPDGEDLRGCAHLRHRGRDPERDARGVRRPH
jgi:methylmalonyl-CoA mutase N-terminal domain/subunit